jgi:acetyl esterase/lipase
MSRTQLGNLTVANDRAANPLTTPAYLDFAKANNFTPDTLTLDDGTQAHWFGSRHAKKTILYYHGGGYVCPPSEGHFQYLLHLQRSLPDASILLLAYTLAPEAQYPTQLIQAVSVLRHLVETEKRDPSTVSQARPSPTNLLVPHVLNAPIDLPRW